MKVAKAHALGMKVFLDLVYCHCGPNNVIKDIVPDAIGEMMMLFWRIEYSVFREKSV